jgi:hypothetical protein
VVGLLQGGEKARGRDRQGVSEIDRVTLDLTLW